MDSGRVPGNAYTYRVTVTDGTGNQIRSAPASILVPDPDPDNGTAAAYARVVGQDGPQHYWRFSEASGTDVADYPLRNSGDDLRQRHPR